MAKTLADYLAEVGASPSLPSGDFTSGGYYNNYQPNGVDPTIVSTPSSWPATTYPAYTGGLGSLTPWGTESPVRDLPVSALMGNGGATQVALTGKSQARAPGASLPAPSPLSYPGVAVGYQNNWGSSAPIYEPAMPNYVGQEVPLPSSALAAINGVSSQWGDGTDPAIAAAGYMVDANGHLVPKQGTNLPATVPFPWPSSLSASGSSSASGQQPLQYEITGGYVWAKSNDGRWVSIGRAPNNPPANPVNMVGQGIAGIGNSMGINLSPMNGLDMAHFLDQQGLAPRAPERIYNPDTNRWEYVNGAPQAPARAPGLNLFNGQSPFGNGLLGLLFNGQNAAAAGRTAAGMVPGLPSIPKPSPTALTPQAAANYAATGTYADNVAANNAANFNRNAGTYNPDVVKQTGGNFSSFSPEWGYS